MFLTSYSMRKSSYHSKTLFHRNQAQASLWFARPLFKNNKRNIKHFKNLSYSLFFLMNIFYNESIRGVFQESCSYNFIKFTAHNLCLWPTTLLKKRLCYWCFKFVKLLRKPFLIEQLMSSACFSCQNFLLSR